MIVLLGVGCGPSTGRELELRAAPLADHVLHDLSIESAYALHVLISGVAVPAGDLPSLRAAIPLPVSGDVDVAIDVVVPGPDVRAAHGTIAIACTTCRVGDDAARLHAGEYFGDLDFGHLTVDTLAARIEVAHGTAELERWVFASPDLELELAMRVELARDWARSAVRGCLRYKVRPELHERAPKTAAVLGLSGAMLGEDGFFHVALEGTLGDMKRLARVCR